MAERNSMFGLYQNMLNSSTKSGGTNNYGMMQTVFQQVHDILNNNKTNIEFNENVMRNPYGFNEYIDPNMIIKMKILFDNYCDIIDKQNNDSPSKQDKKKERKLHITHLKDILQLFGFHFLSDEEINKLQHTIKNVYSMQITFDTLFQILLKEIDPSKDENILKSAFRKCDIDKENRLSIIDLEQMLHNLNIDKHTQGQLRHLLYFVNNDKNKEFLSFRDFCKMMNMDFRLFERVEFEYKTANTNPYKFHPPNEPTIKRTSTPYRYTKAATSNKKSDMKKDRAKSGVFHRNYGTQKATSGNYTHKSKHKQRSRPATATKPMRSKTNRNKMNKTMIAPKLGKFTSR